MKIGIDIRTLMDKKYSGVSFYTFELVKEILDQDKTNSYVLYYNSFKDIESRIPVFSGNVEIVRTRWPNKIFNYVLQKNLNWPRIDSKLNVDLFFMPHINFVSLSGHTKKIITIHDLSFLRYPSFFYWRKNLWHNLINVKKLLKKFDLIIAVSENTRNDIIELTGVPADKVKVIYSGLSDQYARVTGQEKLANVKIKYGLPDNFLLYLGTIEPRKNIGGLIRAFEMLIEKNEKMAGYNLVIAGGNGWKSKDCLADLAKSKYKNKIKLIGYVDEDDKPSLYSLASVFVYPSFYEGFGFPPLEALACGCPVITSISSSLPEVVGKDAILVNPYDVNEIASAMKSVLTNVADNKILTDNSINIRQKFNWKNTARQYLEFFEKTK